MIKYSITNNLENIRKVTKCGWIHTDVYYTMINYRCNSSTNYTTGGDLTDKISDHVIVLSEFDGMKYKILEKDHRYQCLFSPWFRGSNTSTR